MKLAEDISGDKNGFIFIENVLLDGGLYEFHYILYFNTIQ